MRLSSFTMLVIIFFNLVFPAFSRVGETEYAVTKRYGPPIDDLWFGKPANLMLDPDDKAYSGGKRKTVFFKSGGMLIAVDFIGGVSEREIFSKLREPGTKREPGYDTFCKIEIDEIVKILTVNSTSKKWEKVDSQNDLELKYQTADGNRFAVYREDSILHTIANRKTDETKSYREKDPTLEIYTKKWFQLIGTEIDKTRKKPTESPKTNSLANF